MLHFSQLGAGAAVLLGLLSSASYSQDDLAMEPSVVRGKALVVENCSGCPAIGEGSSPHPSAPPFRSLGERYPIDALEETFVESIDTGHPGMPVFEASQQQITDIIDYIAIGDGVASESPVKSAHSRRRHSLVRVR